MAAEYIYLLREREFINANQEVYKVGRTKQENQTRFKQYPKGSVLYFQMICNDCNNIEKQVLNLFKEKFINRKDIGSEYFGGDYNEMINIIYSTIKQYKLDDVTHDEQCATYESNPHDENEYNDPDEEEIRYEITTYDEWIKYTKIDCIIITNKKKGEGYFRFKGQLWRELYDKNRFDFDENNMEVLSELIECNQPILWKIDSCSSELLDDKKLYEQLEQKRQYKRISVDYNVQEICKDILKKCYVSNYDYYNLKSYEYVLWSAKPDSKTGGTTTYYIFNSQTFTFVDVDTMINNKILTCKHVGGRFVLLKDMCDIDIVEDILNTLIEPDIKHKYKTLLRNLIVKPNEKQLIFYDSGECLMTTFVTDLLYTMLGSGAYVSSDEYFHNRMKFHKNIKITKPRCILIKDIQGTKLETQINIFEKLGFKNIIVYDCYQQTHKPIYNIAKYKNYLQENKQQLLNLIKEENRYEIEDWNSEIQHYDSIFYKSKLLMTNFLRWCCSI